MSESPFFSILLPTFNRARLVARAVESVFRQSFGQWQLVIIDDGSVDETFEVLKPYVLKDHRLCYLYQQNQGLAGARNAGLELAKGRYVTFLDSDDEYLLRHLELRHAYLQDHPEVELLHGGVEIIGSAFVPDKLDPSKKIPLSECVIGGTFVIREDLLKRLGGFSRVIYGDDRDFFDRAKASGAHIERIDAATYRYYRTESDSLCSIVEREGLEGIEHFRRVQSQSKEVQASVEYANKEESTSKNGEDFPDA